MKIGILGTGSMATSLALAWARAGHAVAVAGRTRTRAEAVAEKVGHGVEALEPAEAVLGRDAVVLAVTDAGVEPILQQAGGPQGALEGVTLLDCVNTFEYPSGRLRADLGSASERAATVAPGSHVVKALTHFPGTSWLEPDAEPGSRTVAMAGDDLRALELVSALVGDLGARPVVLGSLDRARQIEESAGFVVAIVGAGADPRSAVPSVPGAA